MRRHARPRQSYWCTGISADGGRCSLTVQIGDQGGTCANGHFTPLAHLVPSRLSGAIVVSLADVVPQPVYWYWPGRIPLGKVTVLEGDPGLGKSTMLLDVAARGSRGDAMPDGSAPDLDGPSGVVLLSSEDGLADTVRPRLDAAGADLSRVLSLVLVNEAARGGTRGERHPTLDDVDELADACDDVGARLVVVDPITDYLPADVSINREQEIRQLMSALRELAEERQLAIVLVRHLNKRVGLDALHRGGGAVGVIGSARSGLLVAKDRGDPSRRIVATQKMNLAVEAPSLAYRLVRHTVGAIEVARVEWEGESDLTADDLLAEPAARHGETATNAATIWLVQALSDGPRPARDLAEEAKASGISAKALRTAREGLGIRPRRDGFGSRGLSLWALPSGDAEQPPLLTESSIDALAPIDALIQKEGKYGKSGQVWPESATGEGS